jgi:uncharacterized iron-regulated protein|tara:strand:+ start:682 stop:813 length:132 start_codon:yes stop_codon:yes gene_type:complete
MSFQEVIKDLIDNTSSILGREMTEEEIRQLVLELIKDLQDELK